MNSNLHFNRCKEVILSYDDKDKLEKLNNIKCDDIGYNIIIASLHSIVWAVTITYENMINLTDEEFEEKIKYNQLYDVYYDARNANAPVKDAKNYFFNQPTDFITHFLACYSAGKII